MMEPIESTIDYAAVLADLEGRRAAIDAAIDAVRQIVASGGGPSNPKMPVGKLMSHADIPQDAFFSMSVPDAVKKYLAMMKQPRGTKDIIDALEKGGLQHQSENFYTTVHSTLLRREKQKGDIIRFKRKWAIAEWYSGKKQGGKSE